MKAIITGATGLLGRELMHAFADVEEVLGVSRTRVADNVRQLDLNDFDAVEALVTDYLPDVVVHAAALRQPDDCERDPAATMRFNAELPAHLARLAKENGFWLLLISTDYVFDGTHPPYKPNSAVNPLNTYGKSKAEGETKARQADWGAGVLRVPVLFGPVQHLGESSVTSLFKAVLDRDHPCELDDYNIRHPTHTADVAWVCRQLAERKMKHCGLNGIWHFSGNQAFTKYQMAVNMATALGVPHAHLSPAPRKDDAEEANATASRPYNPKLDCSTLPLMGIKRNVTPFETAIVPVLKPHLPTQ